MRSPPHTPRTPATCDTPRTPVTQTCPTQGRVSSWTISETTNHEGQASPSEGASTRGTLEPAPEPEVIEVTLDTDPDTLPLSVRYVRYGPRYPTYLSFSYDRYAAQ